MYADVLVVGAGAVGAALAYGIAKQKKRVIVLDGTDQDLRAARANFGLVWVQGKGADDEHYGLLSRQSADLWPDFQRELAYTAETQMDYSRPGGLIYCLGEGEYAALETLNKRIHNRRGELEAEMVERKHLERMLPAVNLGQEVVGASYSKFDGHVNPLLLLAALHRAIVALGGQLMFRSPVVSIRPVSGGFAVLGSAGEFYAQRVIVAAGLSTPSLTEPLGLKMPLLSDRGQLLVTERLVPILPLPGSGLRQTADGTVMIGATKEQTSDRGVTVTSGKKLADRATRIIPALASVRLVRQWSGFRIMPPDGSPIYAQSQIHPGLFAIACHSGVTLAAMHAEKVAPAILEGRLSQDFPTFCNGRFDVQEHVR